MKRRLLSSTVFLVLCILTRVSSAGPDIPEGIEQMLKDLSPGSGPDSVQKLPARDLYEVMFGPEIFYLSKDGRYLFRGDILDLKEKRNLSREKRNLARSKSIEGLGEESMIVFGPEDASHTITVFTDIDCAYCVKFHREVPELVNGGVKVRYLAFPRAGIGSGGYRKAVNVWCAKDRQQAMTDAKSGRKVADSSCDDPVAEHYRMGQAAGVTGTPTLVLESGQVIPGYVPAKRLLKGLE